MGELALGHGPPGFRLESLELFNWGTFHENVWHFPVAGRNALVTGEIGSGKSTLVDALTTLLYPQHRITYNKAAGAERRERTIRGYILGEYSTSRDEETSGARAVHLRNEGSYTVILAVFQDAAATRLVTIGHLYWLRGGEVQRIHVVSGRRLTVLEDFGKFDGDGPGFRRRLRALQNTEVHDSFADYWHAMRSYMGLTEKALELYYQTVSMKSVGDLDDFVRTHMLERAPVGQRVEGLLRNYDNLRTAHDAVQRTRERREALRPIVAEGKEHRAVEAAIDELRGMMDCLPMYVLDLLVPLLEEETARLGRELEEARLAVQRVDTQLRDAREREASLVAAIEDSEVGRRIAEISREMERLARERDERRARCARYEVPAASLGYAVPQDALTFASNLRRAQTDAAALAAERESAVAGRDQVQADLRMTVNAQTATQEELESLRRRTSSVPARYQTLRTLLVEALEIPETELPFAAELMRVREAERVWVGAAERVLRGFGLSLLVSEAHYRRVSQFVRSTDLRDRLVYFRVPDDCPAPARPRPAGLAAVLEVKSDSPHRNWVETELGRRFDYTRCDTMEEFYREPDAVTREGLLKMGKVRHEKDDRAATADPRAWILGWSNKDKIELLQQDLARIQKNVADLRTRLAEVDRLLERNQGRRGDLTRLEVFTSFEELDWRAPAARLEEARLERERLEKSSDVLARLRADLGSQRVELARLEDKKGEHLKRSGALESELARGADRLESARRNLGVLDRELRDRFFPPLDDFAGKHRPSLSELDTGWQDELKRRLDTRRESHLRREREIRGSLVKRAQVFLSRFPESAAELTAGVESIQEFAALLDRIERDDLPAHEERFRALLRESTLNDIALFQQQLENDSTEIRGAVDEINKSLRGIEYNPGTYIRLSADRRDDQAVKDFRADLRHCLENTVVDEELYSETKFLQVKKLLDRFAADGTVDRSWTEHVTDVRSWFTFTASERYTEDDTEKEYYSSSSGKSGGQKEKLAYTILASALSHQYGQGRRSGAGGFRLAVIDEAFGRGSEESTRYALRLFHTLDLQLLIVTPLQKLSVIEGHVSSVHFIANPDGRTSQARSLTIQEYQEERERRQAPEPGP